MHLRQSVLPIVFALSLGASFSGGPGVAEDMHMDHTQMGGMKMEMGKGPADAAYDHAMKNMDRSMPPMTGDANVDFVTMMLPHHQAAVDMAKAALQYADDPFVRKLAGDIVKSQEGEIVAMKEWLATHRKDQPKSH